MSATIAVREHGLPMSGPLIAPTMDGRKRQTRRLHGLQRINEHPDELEFDRWQDGYKDGRLRAVFFYHGEPVGIVCPYGQPGDRLWVRETWAVGSIYDDMSPSAIGALPQPAIRYPADGELRGLRLRPSIHMPRWASRITLELTDVRVERVQDISEDDARAEGVQPEFEMDVAAFVRGGALSESTYRLGFKHTWDELNKARGYGWAVNPWVFVLKFRRVVP